MFFYINIIIIIINISIIIIIIISGRFEVKNDNSWSCEKKCSGCNGNYVQMIYECAVIIFMFLRILVNSEVI